MEILVSPEAVPGPMPSARPAERLLGRRIRRDGVVGRDGDVILGRVVGRSLRARGYAEERETLRA